MNLFTVFPLILGFFLTLIFTPFWIKKCEKIGLLWEDMNKSPKIKNVASSGGIVVIMAFTLSILSYVAIRTFVMRDGGEIKVEIFALLTTILILSGVGLTDDLFGWKRKGLSIKFRLFLALFASIPLVVINAGIHVIALPLLGNINLGLIYPLILIPLGIVGTTTTYNFLAGFNGLEAGQGIIILSFLSFIAYLTESTWLAIIGLCMVVALLAFYIFNKYPAKIFPGDVLTYPIGALIAIMAILGNFEKIAFFVFIPYILETILKIRGKLEKQSFGKPNKKGGLEPPYKKIYGLTHLVIYILKKFKKQVSEKDVVYLIFIFQIIIILLSLIIFGGTLFK